MLVDVGVGWGVLVGVSVAVAVGGFVGVGLLVGDGVGISVGRDCSWVAASACGVAVGRVVGKGESAANPGSGVGVIIGPTTEGDGGGIRSEVAGANVG